MTNIVVPALGESVVEARVTRWLKKAGDRVEVGEPVVELETEKIDLEVSADHRGVLTSITRQEGDDVKVGEVLAVVDESAAAAPPETPAGGDPSTTKRNGGSTSTAAAQAAPATQPVPAAQPVAAAEAPKATPTARRMARDHEVNIGTLQGSGAAGRVTKQDVRNALGADQRAATAAPAAPAPVAEPAGTPDAPGRVQLQPDQTTGGAVVTPPQPPATMSRPSAERTDERIRMSKRRQTIARRLVEAQRTAAMLTTFNELDMTALMELRERRKDAFKKQYGVGLGIASFFVKASVAALRAFPQLNAEVQGDEIILKHYYDIGMAVGAEGGLVVPVLRDADRMSFVDIERAIRDYAQRAGDGTLTINDLTGGTFTITNGGIFGSLLSTPILNPPQVGILGLHKIQDRPVAVTGQVIVRPMMYAALTYDHRIVDGREAVQFLVKIKELIEDPGHLLLES